MLTFAASIQLFVFVFFQIFMRVIRCLCLLLFGHYMHASPISRREDPIPDLASSSIQEADEIVDEEVSEGGGTHTVPERIRRHHHSHRRLH